MKKYFLISGLLLLLISCKKNGNQVIDEKNLSDTIIAEKKSDSTGIKNAIDGVIFANTDSIKESKELDLQLLQKIAPQLKINYSDIRVDKTSSISYNDQIVFFVITYAQAVNNKEKDISIERKYVFARKINGKILAAESDPELSHLKDEVIQASKSYILKDLIQLNHHTAGIAFYTDLGSGGGVQYWRRKFTIITFTDSGIKKVLNNYTIGRGNSEMKDDNTDKIETLEAGLQVSKNKTNGFYDLIVSKSFLYEEWNRNGEDDTQGKTKVKKETEVLKYNGKNYTFDAADKMRFLSNLNE